MHPGRRGSIAITSLFAAGALALSACGTEASPGAGGSGSATTTPSPGATRSMTTPATMPDGALSCPATITDRAGMTVPQPPSGVDGTARLLPDRTASSMVVCAYPVLDISATTPLAPPFTMASRTVATSAGRAALTDRLAWAPRGGGTPGPCTAIGGDETAYLVGAVYGGSAPGVVWVAAKSGPNSCSPATNGEFVARAGVGDDIEAIFTERLPSPISSAGAACVVHSSGRLGDDRSLAPDGQPSVTVCRPGRDSQIPTVLDAGQSAQVVAALRALPAASTTGTCSMADAAQNSRQRAFRLVLRYPAGPPAVVDVSPGCRPELIGAGLQAGAAASVIKLVEQWSKPLPYLDPNGSVSSNGSGSSTGSGQGGATGTPGTPTGVAPAGPAMGTPMPPSGIRKVTPVAPSQTR